MKLKNERIFTADLYETQNFYTKVDLEIDGVCVGSHNYDEKLVQKNIIVVKFGTSYYVPVNEIKGLFSYASVAQYVSGSYYTADPKNRILQTEPLANKNGAKFLKNVQPLFAEKGKTSLDELLKKQPTIPPQLSGGMELYLY